MLLRGYCLSLSKAYLITMPKTRAQKEVSLKDLQDKFSRMKAAVLVNFFGLKVLEVTKMRNLLRAEKIDYVVIKKTLLKKAAAALGLALEPEQFKGGVGIAVSYDDEVAPAKILAKFGKEHEALKIHAGILENKLVDMAVVMSLAKLPSKPELLAKAVGSIKAPLTGMVNVLAGNLRGLVQILKAIEQRKA